MYASELPTRELTVTIAVAVGLVGCTGESTPSSTAQHEDLGVDRSSNGDAGDLDSRIENAIWSRDLSALRRMLDEEPSRASHRFQSGQWPGYEGPTALMYAGACGWMDVVDLLVARGARYTEETHNGINAMLFAMHLAGNNGDGVEVFVKRCLDAGVDPCVTTPWGLTAFDAACFVSPIDSAVAITNLLYATGCQVQCDPVEPAQQSAIFMALFETGKPAVARVMLDQQPGLLLCEDSDGRTPFQVAIEQVDLAAMAVLLEAGADPLTRAEGGRTALASLSTQPFRFVGSRDLAASVIARLESNLNLTDQAGDTPLILCIKNDSRVAHRKGSVPLLGELILEAGANPDVAGGDGDTPLHIAVGERSLAWTRLLLRFDADPDQLNAAGVTAREMIDDLATADPQWGEIARSIRDE